MTKTSFTVQRDKLQVVMERIFNAPRELIWKIISDPKMIPQWWGPARFETVVDKMDFRAGGEWRFIHKAGGEQYSFHGVYGEIIPDEKISDTFNYEPIGPGHEMVEILALADLGNGTTRAVQVSVFHNIEDLEAMVYSGMEGGATETWERLAKLVEKPQQTIF